MTLTLYVKYLRGEKQGQFCLQDLVLVQTNELYLKTLKGNGQKKLGKVFVGGATSEDISHRNMIHTKP